MCFWFDYDLHNPVTSERWFSDFLYVTDYEVNATVTPGIQNGVISRVTSNALREMHLYILGKGKVKVILLQARCGPDGG